MDDLRELKQRGSIQEIWTFAKTFSPLQSKEWAKGLCQHPDNKFNFYAVREINEGGFTH